MTHNRLILILLGLMAVLLLSMGCNPQYQEPEPTMLQLSSTVISFGSMPPTSSQHEEIVEVDTDASRWSALTQADWISLRTEGNRLAVSVQPNNSTLDRYADVVVMAGTRATLLKVLQSAAEMILEVPSVTRHVAAAGGEVLIPVSSNAGQWTVDMEAESSTWLKVSAHQGFVRLVLTPNTQSEQRSTYLTIRAKDTECVVHIEQSAFTRTFQVPYLIPAFTSAKDIVEREAKMYGNEILYFTEGNDMVIDLPNTYSFACRDSYYQTVAYAFAYGRVNTLVSVTYAGFGIKDKLMSEEFRHHLTEQGFELSSETDAGRDFSGVKHTVEGTYKVSVQLRVPGTYNKSQVVYTFVEVQPQKYPTFKTFPWDNAHYIGNAEYPYQQIKQLETAVGKKISESGKITGADTEMYTTLTINMDQSYHPLLRRTYRFDKGKEGVPPTGLTYEIEVRYDDHSLAFWKNSLGKWVLTEEFEALLAKEGFRRLATAPDTFEFVHPERNLKVVVRAAFMSGKYVLAIRYMKA